MTDPETPSSEMRAVFADLAPEDHERLAPPASVWEGIVAGLDLDEGTRPVSLDQARARRRLPTTWLLAAAASIVVVALASVALLSGGDDGTVLATAVITSDGLPLQAPGPGEARLVSRDGELELDLDLPELPAASGYYEVWVIDPQVEGMFSLGVVDRSRRFELPPGVDPAAYPIVDISVEPLDGNPAHSGQSIWRGRLEI